VSDSARTVLGALLSRCDDLGVMILTDHRVCDIVKEELFIVSHSRGQMTADRLILCTGGRSLPRTGSDGFGWELARKMGHHVTPTYPALVPLVLAEGMFHAELSGLTHEAELSTFADGKRIDRRSGSMLWTHFGVSGPVVLDASRHYLIARAEGRKVELRCNVCVGKNPEQVEREWIAAAGERPKAGCLTLLSQHLPERLGKILLQHTGIDPATAAGQLPREGRRKLMTALTALPLPVERDRGWNYAEVTAGGVPLEEINFRTMESRKTPGLYLAGEILDCDGRIGGFNFQWAWATGYLAGTAAA
jgi:predicted Rossmann fold flavoprotein